MEEVLSERITDELVVFIIKKDKPLTSMLMLVVYGGVI